MASNPDLFVSHNSKDKTFIDYIAKRLNDEYDVKLWLDKWSLEAAVDWAPAIEKALQSCDSCAVVLGANGWGPHHLGEAQLALKRKREYPNFRVIPILLPGASSDNMVVLGDFFQQVHRVEFTGHGLEEEAFQRLWATIRGEAPGPPLMTAYKIERDAKYWERLPSKDKRSALYAGEKLRDAQEIAGHKDEPISQVAKAFLDACVNDERDRIREAQRRTRKIIGGLVIGIIIVSILAVVALFLSDRERKARLEATASAAEAERQAGLAKENEKEAKRQEGIAKENETTARSNQTKAEDALAKLAVKTQQLKVQVVETLKQKNLAVHQAYLANNRAKAQNLRVRLLELEKEATNYTDLDTDRAFEALKQMADIYKELKETENYLTTVEQLAEYIYKRRSNDIDYAQIATGWLETAIKATDSPERKAKLHARIATMYLQNGRGVTDAEYNKYQEAANNYKMAIGYLETAGRYRQAACRSLELGNMYSDQDDLTSARQFYEKAAKLYPTYTHDSLEGTALYLIAKTHSEERNQQQAKRYYDLALRVLEKFLADMDATGEDDLSVTQATFMLGDAYADLGDLKKSALFFDRTYNSKHNNFNELITKRRKNIPTPFKYYCELLLPESID